MANGGIARELTSKEADIQKMLAAEVHLGAKNCDFQMERYVFKRRNDGIYIINLGKTWEKLQMAARVIVAMENPQDIIYTGANAIAGCHTPGTFTNQLQTLFSDPVSSSALGNIPTIAFCDTDSPMRYVDIGIPANNKGKHNSNGRLWLTAKEEEEEAELADYVDYSAPALGGTDQWSSQIPDAQWNNEGVQAAIPAVPGATGWTADAVPSADGWDVAPEPTLAAAPGLDIRWE
ncbi:hypothetical protein ACET3Z_032759 [Daucus carota]